MRPKFKTKTVVLLLILLRNINSILLSPLKEPVIGQAPVAYKVSEYLNPTTKLTLLGWFGVGEVSECAFSLKNGEDSFPFNFQWINPQKEIHMKANVINLPTANNTISNISWFRLALSVADTTVSTTAHLFIENTHVAMPSSFSSVNDIELLFGSCSMFTTVNTSLIKFSNIYILPEFYQAGDISFVTTELFKFPPELKLLTHIHKNGPYCKILTNHVKYERDIINGDDYGQILPMNIYTSFEFLGNGIRLPKLNNDDFDYNQSHLISLKFDLELHPDINNNPGYNVRLSPFQRKDIANNLIYGNRMDLLLLGSLDFTINFMLEDIIGDNQYKYLNMGSFLALPSPVSFDYYYMGCEKTIFDTNATFRFGSNHYTEVSMTLPMTFQDDDFTMIGDTQSRPTKVFSPVVQRVVLRIYEISIFKNTLIDVSVPGEIKTGITHNQFYLTCPAAFMIKRFDLADPFNLIYDSCVDEPILPVCAIVGCLVCEMGICYVCKVGFVLDSSLNTCTQCTGIGKTWDPILRKCIPIGRSELGISLSGFQPKNNDPNVVPTYSVYTEGNSGNPAALNIKTSTFKIKYVNFDADNAYGVLSLLFSTLQYIQFQDDSILGMDNEFYLSFISDVDSVRLYIKFPPASITDMVVSSTDVYVDDFLSLDKNIACPNSYVVKTDFFTVQCVDTCPLGFNGLNKSCLPDPTYHLNCPDGSIRITGTCNPCDDNCRTCEGTVDNCLSCFSNYTLITSTPVNYCSNPFLDFTSSSQLQNEEENLRKEIISEIVEINSEISYLMLNCEIGEYFNLKDKTCSSCVDDCLDCVNYDHCLLCKDGFIMFAGQCIKNKDKTKTNIFEDIYNDGAKNNCKFSIDNVCFICQHGYYLDEYFHCTRCPKGCLDCEDNSFCLGCKEGFLNVDNTCSINCDERIYYWKYETCNPCRSCFNCKVCSSCLKCSSILTYSLKKEDRNIKFIFDENVKVKDSFDYEVLTEDMNEYRTAMEDTENGLSDFYVEGKDFVVDVSQCNVNFHDYYFNVEGKDNVVDFSFNIPHNSFNCFVKIKLKEGLIYVSPNTRVDFKETHSIILKTDDSKQRAQERLILVKTVTFLFFGFSMSSARMMNVVIYMFASFGILDLFIYINDRQADSMMQLINFFTFDFEIFFEIAKNKTIKKHYGYVFSTDNAGNILLGDKYLNYIDLFGIVFIFISFLYSTKYYVRKKFDFQEFPKLKKLYRFFKNYKLGYVLSGVFFFFFNRLLMYKNLVDYEFAIIFGLFDLIIITMVFCQFGILTIKRVRLYWLDKFYYKRKETLDVRNRYMAILPVMLFIRNIGTIFSLVFLKKYRIVAAVFINLFLAGFTYLVFKAYRVERNWYLLCKVFHEICIIAMFNLITFNDNNLPVIQFLLFGFCVVIILTLLLMWVDDFYLKGRFKDLHTWFFREPLIRVKKRSRIFSPLRIRMID